MQGLTSVPALTRVPDLQKVTEIGSVTDQPLTMAGTLLINDTALIQTALNENLNLVPQGTGITQIGDAGAPVSLPAVNDNFFVSGSQEIAGLLYAKGHLLLGANQNLRTATSFGAIVTQNTFQTPDCPQLLTGTISNIWLLCEYDDRNFDFGHAQELDPTWIGHSRNQATDEWWSKTHNTANAENGIGKGSQVTEHEAPVSLADDASFDLPDASAGWGHLIVGDAEEHAYFIWATDGTVTLITNSANVVNTDTDVKFCIFDNGTAVRVRNRLGAAKTVMFDYHYTTSP